MRPYRSALYIPGANTRAMEKARALPCDAILFDLEDAVAPEDKPQARVDLRAQIAAGGYGARALIVRINDLATPWGAQDAAAFEDLPLDGLLLPKVDGPDQIAALADMVPHPIWAMIETASGVLNAPAIAEQARGLVMGTNDLLKDLTARPDAARSQIQYALQQTVLAARAHGIVALDGVCNAIHDTEQLRSEAQQGRDLGFHGKTLIHPAQLPIANQVFAPSADDVDAARRIIAAFEQTAGGVAVLDGRIIESLHVDAARATLAAAEMIAALEAT